MKLLKRLNSTIKAAAANASVLPAYSCALRPRLEEHYYDTLLEDIMILTYDHTSPEADLDFLSKTKEWNRQPSTLDKIYSQKLDKLPTYTESVTTNLLTWENATSKTKTKTKTFKKRLYNPIDYTIVRKEEWDNNEAKVRPPWSPLSSNLPIPKKIILKITSEAAVKNKSILLSAIMLLNSITGIHAVPVFAEVGDSTKGIREGMPIGAMVELQGAPMFDFLDKLAMTVLPRIRDWEGIEGIGDDNGGLALRIPQSAVGYFPDIEPHFDAFPLFFDIDVLIHTTGKSDWETALCISGFQIPFKPKRVIKAEEEKEDNDDPWAKFRKPKTKEERKAQALQRAQEAAKTNEAAAK